MASRGVDLRVSLVSTAAFALSAFLLDDDALYAGFWFCLVVPAAAMLFFVVKSAPFFVSGATLALSATYLSCWLVHSIAHYVSASGALLGLLIARVVLVWFPRIGTSGAFLIAVAGCGVGFAAALVLACNTAIWCGPALSFMLEGQTQPEGWWPHKRLEVPSEGKR